VYNGIGVQAMPNKSDWLTVNEAARLTSYHPERIRELIRDNKIVAQKFSIVWQVNRESLLAYLVKMQKLGKKRGRKPGN
jgi:excisionase family DNA binding protein